MPGLSTIHRESNWKIAVYADDHAPPHFHALTPDGESLVEIETLTETQQGAEKKALKAALIWAGVEANKQIIKTKWDELNERERP
jgi:hypothetical protein